MTMSLPNLLPVMQELLQMGKHSDFTIKCDGETLKAHKAIVCPQSRYFDAALSGEFQVGGICHSAAIADL